MRRTILGFFALVNNKGFKMKKIVFDASPCRLQHHYLHIVAGHIVTNVDIGIWEVWRPQLGDKEWA